jgi:SAM-dependent methyltransferase
MWKASLKQICNSYDLIQIIKCPVCASVETTNWSSPSEYVISLSCNNCSHVFSNKQLHPRDLPSFYENYNEYRRSSDPVLETQRQKMYIEDYKFITRIHPNPRNVLDFGCGTGEFLNMFPSQVRKFGYEIDEGVKPSSIQMITDLSNLSTKFDLIIFRGTFQYIHDLSSIKRFIDEHLEGILVILSLPNSKSIAAQLFRENWGLYNPIEHTHIFCSSSLKTLFHDYQTIQRDFPYLDTPYANEERDLKCFLNSSNGDPEYNFPFWGNIMNISLKKYLK